MSSMDVDKTHEIMARFRPIAPRPLLPAATADKPAVYLQAKPCRLRKHSSDSSAFSPMLPPRRQRGFSPVLPRPAAPLAFRQGLPLMQKQNLTLSLLQSSPEGAVPTVLVENDLLQEPKAIAPQAVRPIGSTISVGPIQAVPATALPQVSKKPEEVEEEMESEGLPTVISDSKNRVRLANAAYKEMVGQPECPWLESMVSPCSKRIDGEVKLDLSGATGAVLPTSSNGFSCSVKIEWESNGKKSFVSTRCDVIRLHCDARDYRFTWKFRTTEDSTIKCYIAN